MKFKSLIKRDTKIKDAIKLMSSSEMNKFIAGITVVVDDESRVLGVLTDGDIRRGLNHGIGIESEVDKIANFSPVTVKHNLAKNEMLKEIITKAKLRKSNYQKFDKIILVDESDKFSDVILLSALLHDHIDYKIIAVYGMGFVGLTLASVLANSGLIVWGIDVNPAVIESLKSGRPHFFENGLESLLTSLIESRQINFTSDYDEVNADVHIVSVGTPIDANKNPVLNFIRDATEAISRKLKKDDLIIYRSTVPVGSLRNIIIPILERNGLIVGRDIYLSFAPERTVEGNAIEELQSLPQVIGGFDQKSTELTASLFGKITKTIVKVDSMEAAEMIKLLNNSYRDLVFSFANEVSLVCDHFNINSFKLIEAANEGYPRNPIPSPSPGVGGLCLSKDPHLFANPAKIIDYKPILNQYSRKINSAGHLYVYDKIKRFCSLTHNDMDRLKIYLIGLAFKGMPETSDIRDSVALDLIDILPERKNIFVKDFVVTRKDIESIGCNYVNNVMDGFKAADIILVMNNHYQNKKFSMPEAMHLINKPALFFDGWNMFNQSEIERHETVYYATMGYMTER